MKRTVLSVVGLFLFAAFASEASAQTRRMVMRQFKCNPQAVGVQLFQQRRPVAQDMIEEGKFIDYGVLSHNWGDEWSVADYFIIDNLDDFLTAGTFGEFNRRRNEMVEETEFEEELPPFGEVCTEHKDNIWIMVAPPGGW